MAPIPDFWTPQVAEQFALVPSNPGEKDYNGAYNKLLYTIFPGNSDFTVVPQYLRYGSYQAAGRSISLVVQHKNKPVLVLEPKKPQIYTTPSARVDADEQIRGRLIDLRSDCPFPILHGVSVLGTRLCVYTLDTRAAESDVEPVRPVKRSPSVNNDADVAPQSWWAQDITDPEQGLQVLSRIVQYVKEQGDLLNS